MRTFLADLLDEFVWKPFTVLILATYDFCAWFPGWFLKTAPAWLAVVVAWLTLDLMRQRSDPPPPQIIVDVRSDLEVLLQSSTLSPEDSATIARIMENMGEALEGLVPTRDTLFIPTIDTMVVRLDSTIMNVLQDRH